MSVVKVDARGEQCPIPVVKTRKALEANSQAEGLVVLVSEMNAAQNVQRLAQNRGCEATITSEADYFAVAIAIKPGANVQAELSAEELACTVDPRRNIVVAIGSATMGEGNAELGQVLMKGFIYALSQQDVLPKCVLFYNGGAQFTCEGSVALEDIKSLEASGVEILTCGTCLDYYQIKDKLAVGQVTNMYAIVEKMMGASQVVKP